MEENLKALCQVIPNKASGQRFILGVDGLSRSGKTTLVEKLSKKLTDKDILFVVFHMDDHIVERKKRYHTGNEEWYEYYYLQWDRKWLREHFFEKLMSTEQIVVPFYDSETDAQMMKSIKLPKDCVIVIEGVFLQRKEWRSFYNYVVYLDCPQTKRFLRETIVTQKNIIKFEHRYWKAEEFYLKTEDPKANANLVLHN